MTNAMTLELIPLSKIQPSPDNPRKCFDTVTIKGLAASIKADGLLQNLVLSKPKGRKKSYTIIAGERRYRAMALLVERGELSEDFAIPAEIKDGLSEQDVRRIATIENVQRENLPPIEEAEAVASLLQDGMMLDDVLLATKHRLPVAFYGRPGGVVPMPEDILDEIRNLVHNTPIVDGHPRQRWFERMGELGLIGE